MNTYIKGTFKKFIFQSDKNYVIGLFKIKETRRSLKRKRDELDRLIKSEQLRNKTLKERIKVENTPIPNGNKEKVEQCNIIKEK